MNIIPNILELIVPLIRFSYHFVVIGSSNLNMFEHRDTLLLRLQNMYSENDIKQHGYEGFR